MYLSFFNLMLPQYLLQPAGRAGNAEDRVEAFFVIRLFPFSR
jgi:hypothetical protein